MASVSIVIPVLNGGDFLQELFNSLDKFWDVRIDQIHVIDNNSSDDTWKVATDWLSLNANRLGFDPHLTCFPENRGFGPAVNIGIEKALAKRGVNYVCIFNVDQLVQEWWLDWLIRALREYPRLGMASAGLWEVGTPEEYEVMPLPDNVPDAPLRIAHRDPVTAYSSKGCPWLFTRAALQAIGEDGFYFDPRFAFATCEDWDVMARMAIKGFEYARVDNVPCYHFVGSRGQAEARKRAGYDFNAENARLFCEKWGIERPTDFHLKLPPPFYG